MKKSNWKEQLNEVLSNEGNERDGVFGTNIDWEVKSVKKFLSKLETLGITNINIPNYDTIELELPPHSTPSEVFLQILTMHPKPCDAIYNKKKCILTLCWDY